MLRWDPDTGESYDDGQIDPTLAGYTTPPVTYAPDYDPTLVGYVPPEVTYDPGAQEAIAAVNAQSTPWQIGFLPDTSGINNILKVLQGAPATPVDVALASAPATGGDTLSTLGKIGQLLPLAGLAAPGAAGLSGSEGGNMATPQEILTSILGLAGSPQASQLLGAVGVTTTGTGAGKLAGSTILGTSHGLIQIRTPSGKVVWIKRAKKRRSTGRRSGGGGMGRMENMMMRLAMLKALK